MRFNTAPFPKHTMYVEGHILSLYFLLCFVGVKQRRRAEQDAQRRRQEGAAARAKVEREFEGKLSREVAAERANNAVKAGALEYQRSGERGEGSWLGVRSFYIVDARPLTRASLSRRMDYLSYRHSCLLAGSQEGGERGCLCNEPGKADLDVQR